MTEMDIWEHIKVYLGVVGAPILGWISYRAKKREERIADIEERQRKLEEANSIFEVKIGVIFSDIKDIKSGVEKLIDRQLR